MRRREFLATLAAAPASLLALEAAGARPAGGWALAFVTADLESRIVAVDMATGAIVARIATPPGPRSIETVMPRTAVVACTAGGSVVLVDSFERRVRHVLDGLLRAALHGGRLGRATWPTSPTRCGASSS